MTNANIYLFHLLYLTYLVWGKETPFFFSGFQAARQVLFGVSNKVKREQFCLGKKKWG